MDHIFHFDKTSPQILAALAFCLFLSFFSFPACADQQNIVVLNSYHQGFTWTDEQVAGMSRTLRHHRPEFDLYVEYLDAKRFPGPARRQRLRKSLRAYIADRRIDLLLTTDNLALDFALAERDSLFPGVPIVFSGINGYRPEMLGGATRVTGVVEEIDPAGTLEIAFRLQPQADTVLVIFDGTESGRKTQEATLAAAPRFDRNFIFLNNPTLEEVLQAVRQLPANAFILLGNFNRDRNGAVFSHEEALAHIGGASKVPIYGLWDFLFGQGIVGGSLLSGQAQGEHAAKLALRILEEGAADIPVETTSPSQLLFDYRQLQAFDLNPKLLPPGSQIIYRPPTFFAEHRILVFATGTVILFLGYIIGILLRSTAARKRVAVELQERTAFLQTIIDALPAPIYYKDRAGIYLGCNQAFEQFIGLPRQKILGQSVYGVAPKEMADIYFRADQELLACGRSQSYEGPVQYADGTVHSVLFHKATFADHNGDCAGMVGAMLDITERKHRELELEALAQLAIALRAARSSEDMYRIIFESLLDVVKVNGALIVTRKTVATKPTVEVGLGVCASLQGRVLAPELLSVRSLFDKQSPFQLGGELLATIFSPLPAGMEHVACVPMLAHDKIIGVFAASGTQPFAADELRLLGSMTEMGAGAIHRRELHERTELQLNRLSTLRSIDQAIINSHDFAQTMDILLEQVSKQMHIDAAAILCHSRPESLAFGAARGFRTAHIRDTRLAAGEGIAGRAVRERRLLFVSGRAELKEQSSRWALIAEEDFAFYCAVPLVARGEIQGVLELFHRTPLQPEGDWLEFLEALGLQAAIALDNTRLFAGLQQSNSELLQAYERTIEGWSQALELRDRETEGHSLRVTEMAMRLAQAMGIAEAELVHIRHGALLHDIGKMGIPDHILGKPGPLTPAEWEIMKTHPKLAYQLLSPIAYLRPALDIPYGHHEKWDGSGYPMGLAGEQIPLAARLFAIVDVWDALLSDRPYRAGWPEEEVRRYLRDEAGRHFDPRLVEIFLALS